jgi:hypothetical protein
MTERSIVADCKSAGLVPTGVQIPLPAPSDQVRQLGFFIFEAITMNEFDKSNEHAPVPDGFFELPDFEYEQDETDTSHLRNDTSDLNPEKVESEKPNSTHVEINQYGSEPNEPTIEPPCGLTHPEVLRFNDEKNACSVKLPDSMIDDDFVLKNKIVYFDVDGEMMQGESPHESVNDFVHSLLEKDRIDETKARRAISEATDLNDKFSDVLEEVYANRTEEGLPIKILSQETYKELGDNHPLLESHTTAAGYNAWGYEVVREPSDSEVEVWGHKLLQFLIHHEDNHSNTKQGTNTIYTFHTAGSNNELSTVSIPVRSFADGFSITERDGTGKRIDKGHMFEEGYAELKALMAVNDFDDIDHSPHFGILPNGALEYVENNADTSNYSCVMPTAFLQAKVDDFATYSHDYSSAAYSLYQLDLQRPGIIDNLSKAHKDPRHFDKVIEDIESIRPGLFRELYELPRSKMSQSTWLVDPNRPFDHK